MPIFRLEKHLRDFLARYNLVEWLSPSTTLVRREQPVGGRIPDILYVVFQEPPPQDIWPSSWISHHTFLVWHLRRAWRLHIETIAQKSYLPVDVAESLLRSLEVSGAVCQADSGSYFLSDQLVEIGRGEVVAVEAKLTRWQDAMDQAIQYQAFADRVVVAMDASWRVSEKAVRIARDNSVGLCVVSEEDVCWVVRPRRVTGRTGPNREYILASATDPRRQTGWDRL